MTPVWPLHGRSCFLRTLPTSQKRLRRDPRSYGDATSSKPLESCGLQLAVSQAEKDKEKARNKAVTAKAQRDKALQSLVELYAVACGSIYGQLGILEDNSAWAKYAPVTDLLGFPEPYSPLILLGFIKKEYMNQPTEEDGEEAQAN
ncbi:hypothetical protein Acr_05g0003320 [Actinidia rufa]|uniref:Uncharacterized protein n=1 Tax=Actinidia rufa TaxID=165716 RepID=A0A7J0EJP7_9ERIC|nr:hypothetical protein Acr_05g0003320 [Actinidia rufa]